LSAEYHNQARFQRMLTYFLANLAKLHGAAGRSQLEREFYQQALDLQERIVHGDPKDQKLNRDLEFVLNGMAIMLVNRREPAKAEEMWRRGLAITEDLAREHPSEPRYAYSQTITLGNLANVLHFYLRRPDEGLAIYKRALPISEKLVHEFPETSEYRSGL